MKLLLYCTKAKPQLFSGNSIYNQEKIFSLVKGNNQEQYEKLETLKCLNNLTKLNGKIVAECDFEVEKHNETTNDWLCMSLREKIVFGNLCEKANIDELECYKYADGKPLYAIHIKNLHIFDEPRELSCYDSHEVELFSGNGGCLGTKWLPITKAPQNMQYCYDEGEKKVLISIRPEWLCKILNGEKTIEVRRKVLKEMLK